MRVKLREGSRNDATVPVQWLNEERLSHNRIIVERLENNYVILARGFLCTMRMYHAQFKSSTTKQSHTQ